MTYHYQALHQLLLINRGQLCFYFFDLDILQTKSRKDKLIGENSFWSFLSIFPSSSEVGHQALPGRLCRRHGRRREGQEDLQDEVQPVPYSRGRRQTQDRAQPARSHRPPDRPGTGLQLHERQQVQGHHVERGHAWRVPIKPQEVHSWHQDGLRRPQEEGRERRCHRLLEGRHLLIEWASARSRRDT